MDLPSVITAPRAEELHPSPSCLSERGEGEGQGEEPWESANHTEILHAGDRSYFT